MAEDIKIQIGRNVKKVQERIEKAAIRAGRDPGEIDLVAVTKQKSAVVVKALIDCGIKRIGESYLKEALFKIDLLRDFPIEWHMIGNIQNGKEKKIAQAFSCVHSVGEFRTAVELNKYAGKMDKTLPVYLEMNVSGQDTKGGWLAVDHENWEDLLPEISKVLELANISVVGLMTMAPYSVTPEDSRPYFNRLRKIREFLGEQLPKGRIAGLSMGMSGDFEVAIEEGATILRIGSALVGPRD
jgi:PLP dependent protein